jgi:acetylornithine/N-succinyldiaminopimelate aminotransferase
MNKQPPTNYQDLDSRYYLPVFRRLPLTLVRGRGSRVWDDRGNEYIDVMAGIAVNSVGHCHPHVVEAIQSQASELMHISNFFISKPQMLLAEKLVQCSGMDRVFFTNSGAESNEGAIKMARKYAHAHNRGGHVISFTGSFHGRTMATIATGKKKMQEGFEPIPEGFRQIEFNNLEALQKAIDQDTAAIIVEPLQGEGGIHMAGHSFIQSLREICDDNNMVLIFDEIQCGMGRTGHFFAGEHYGVQPDILTAAKALGGGVPIGAILTNQKVAETMEPGDHGTTFGGNPLVTAAALATIEVIEKENLLQQAREKGEWLQQNIRQRDTGRFGIREVRGMGLMVGIEFEFETKPLMQKMLEKGVLANATAENVLRLVPPLNIPYEDLEKTLEVLFDSIQEMQPT